MTRRDPLTTYREKRDFEKTSEPSGEAAATERPERVFVIQKHAARALHYDLRLEVDGVLKSWAVPKGPSTDPRQRRLAVATEDHPMEYATFEGVIPAGEYGGGTVIVWDAGTYRNLKRAPDGQEMPMAEALAAGRVEVALAGRKLLGGYALVRTDRGESGKEQWLLIKMKGEGADARRNPVSTEPTSVLTGRTLEEVAAAEGQGG